MASDTGQPISPAAIDSALERVFGFSQFRPNQKEIVTAILRGRDVFAVMPTGGGKSLCYQLPACLGDGPTIVVSPLISLMADQVESAVATGLRAEYFNSTLSPTARSEVVAAMRRGEIDLLYVSPERFAMDGFVSMLEGCRPVVFAIDEAHCISEWGHDFRPDYLRLANIVKAFPHAAVAAFTATATCRVQEDIIDRLGLREPLTVRASFDRPNLFYRIETKTEPMSQILEFVRRQKGEPGIVYRTTRNDVEGTAGYLQKHGVSAAGYHAGMDSDVRAANQDAFTRDEVQVVVATIAFGMGIDKSNVRFVVHGDLPRNLEGYYQETGRAGRDGEPAQCMLLFNAGDAGRQRYFIEKMENDAEREIANRKLNEMLRFAGTNACRRKQLLNYFDENYACENCQACDVCAGDLERIDATTDARKLMSAVARTQERFGLGHVVDIVTGSNTEKIRRLGHDRLPTHGVGKERPKVHWRRIADDLMAQGCLILNGGQYPTVGLTEKGQDVLFGRLTFQVLRRPTAASPSTPRRPTPGAIEYDVVLFERLRGVRTGLARARGVPPYVIFSDRTLHEMARELPTDRSTLRRITGVGEVKLKRYGRPFLEAIRNYASEGDNEQHPTNNGQ